MATCSHSLHTFFMSGCLPIAICFGLTDVHLQFSTDAEASVHALDIIFDESAGIDAGYDVLADILLHLMDDTPLALTNTHPCAILETEVLDVLLRNYIGQSYLLSVIVFDVLSVLNVGLWVETLGDQQEPLG